MGSSERSSGKAAEQSPTGCVLPLLLLRLDTAQARMAQGQRLRLSKVPVTKGDHSSTGARLPRARGHTCPWPRRQGVTLSPPSGVAQLRETLGLAQVTVPPEHTHFTLGNVTFLGSFRPSKGTFITSLSTVSSRPITTAAPVMPNTSLSQLDVVALPGAYLTRILG